MFQFRTGRFNAEKQQTPIVALLPAMTTKRLPLTEGNDRFVYQVELRISGRSPVLLMRGSVQVLPVLLI
ncbi:hypothetical protein NC995_25250 [Leptolyngbya sp. FACHB-1515]